VFAQQSLQSKLSHIGAMLVFRMLCRITQSSDAHRTESVMLTYLTAIIVTKAVAIAAKVLLIYYTTWLSDALHKSSRHHESMKIK